MPFFHPYKEGLVLATSDKLFLFDGDGGEPKEFVTSNEIACLAVSLATNHIAIATKDKTLSILDELLNTVKQFSVNRNVSQLHFCVDSLLVADKAGDVYFYDLSKEGPGDLLLGHNSMILDLTTSHCGKYVVTCDRDEKIRVSHFPNSYNIAMYCLGHAEFVTNVKMLRNDKILVSTSGDGTVRFWEYLNGKQVSILDTTSLVNKDNLKEFFAGLEDVSKGNALPITNLEIFESEKGTYFAISLCNTENIFLYKFNQENFSCEFVATIDANPDLFCFYKGHLLYVEKGKICSFKLPNGNSCLSQEFLEGLNNKCNSLNLDKSSVNIYGLYKRTFDNLKEYHETKKQRLISD